MSNSYIVGSWENVHLHCGCHGEDVEMELKEGPSGVFYSCPKYYPYNRKAGEKACYNRLSLYECEAMLSHLADIQIEADENRTIIDLNGEKWKEKGVEYEVTHFEDGRTDVTVVNNKALKGTRINTF